MNKKMNAEELITENRQYVEAVAKQYLNRGLTKEQLIGKVIFRVYPVDLFGGL